MKHSISLLTAFFCLSSAFSQNVGIGITIPQANLHVNGTFRFTNGNQGSGKVLTSNSVGEVSWLPASLSLPFSGTSSAAQRTFTIINSGTTAAAGHFETYSGNNFYTLEGYNYHTAGGGAGVYGQTSNNDNGSESAGIYGYSIGTGDQSAGVRGRSIGGPGVIGISQNGIGVYGSCNAANGLAGFFTGTNALYTNGSIRFTGLGEGSGKVFTSDANGQGSWQTPAVPIPGWTLVGNSGTVTATNFIGTTDLKAVNFRMNNLKSGVIGEFSTAFGYQSQLSATGIYNTSFGVNSLKAATGFENTAMGIEALGGNTGGNDNTAIGSNAMALNTTGSRNVAVGRLALALNVANNDLVAVGNFAMRQAGSGASGSIGVHNTAVGSFALELNKSGAENTSMGYYSQQLNDAGNYNTSLGWKTLTSNTASNNTAMGDEALMGNTTGASNTAIGFVALNNNFTGGSNTAIGAFAGNDIPNAISNVTCLGARSGRPAATSNQIFLGNTSITAIIANVTGITAYSDARVKDNIKENVAGLAFIKALRPVTYNLNIHNMDRLLGTSEADSKISGNKRPTELPGKYDGEKTVHTGFIAQEVEAAAKKANYDFSGLVAPKNDKDLYAINYTEFVVPLVKAVQEQQLIIEIQQKKITDQQALLETMENRLKALEVKMKSVF